MGGIDQQEYNLAHDTKNESNFTHNFYTFFEERNGLSRLCCWPKDVLKDRIRTKERGRVESGICDRDAFLQCYMIDI